jgi:hypothetical protein
MKPERESGPIRCKNDGSLSSAHQKRTFLDECGQLSAISSQQNLRKTRDWLNAES